MLLLGSYVFVINYIKFTYEFFHVILLRLSLKVLFPPIVMLSDLAATAVLN